MAILLRGFNVLLKQIYFIFFKIALNIVLRQNPIII